MRITFTAYIDNATRLLTLAFFNNTVVHLHRTLSFQYLSFSGEMICGKNDNDCTVILFCRKVSTLSDRHFNQYHWLKIIPGRPVKMVSGYLSLYKPNDCTSFYILLGKDPIIWFV